MGALDGVKVVEAGLLVHGPQATATLCEWGADVIKVELPNLGDQARWIVMAPDDFRSAFFLACNRGKRSITVDLRTPDGGEVFLRLAEWADVVLTNFTPGTMEGWGLGYEDVAARNPRIVYAVGSTFGTDGPDAGRAGADLSAQSAGGLISTTGRDGGEPTPVGAAVADHIGSQNLLAGVLAALLARERTGRGQLVSSSLLGGQVWAQASELTGCLLRGRRSAPANRSHPMIPGLYGIFPTADGWVAVVGVVGPSRDKFFEVIGAPELATEFVQPMYWDEDKAALFPKLDAIFVTATTDEWCKRLADADLRHAAVHDYEQVLADPGVRANGYVTTVDGPDGPTEVVAAPVRFSDTPAVPPAFAPELGQHTEEVLLEIGYGWDEITRLREAGAL